MTSVFQPPPTWAPPLIEVQGGSTYNPVWIKWFVDLLRALTLLEEQLVALSNLRIARVGMRKTAPLSLGTLNTTWVNIDGYAVQIYSSALGCGYSLTTGVISVGVSDDYIFLVSIQFSCTSDNNSSRQLEVRIFNQTDNVPVAGALATFYVGAYAAGISTSFSVPGNLTALAGKALSLQIRGLQNFAGATLVSAMFSVTSIDSIVQL